MNTHLRMPAAVILLLSIHLLSSRTCRADTESSNVDRSIPSKIVEEAIINGNRNNPRTTRAAVEKDSSRLSHDIPPLPSKRKTRGSRLVSDQNVSESLAATIVHVEDNEDELERLKRIVAKYEPQKIASKIAKRKIEDAPSDTQGAENQSPVSTTLSATDLETAYHEVLRNISRGIPQLVNNPSVTLGPYLSQVVKHFQQIPTAEVTISPAVNGGAKKSLSSNIEPSYTSPVLNKKKLLFKKYTHPNRTIPLSPDRESGLDEVAADISESIAFKKPLHKSDEKPKLKNESSSTSPDPTKKSGNHREWSLTGFSSQFYPSPFTQRFNNRAFSSDKSSKKQPSSHQGTFSFPLKYNKVPRPFSLSATDYPQLSNATDATTNIATLYRKLTSSPANITHEISQSSDTVSPLVLPTDLFNAPLARRYVPIKRANRNFIPDEPYTAATTTFASVTPVEKRTTLRRFVNTDHSTPYGIAATRVSTVTHPDYYVIPRNYTVGQSTTTYIPGQSSTPHIQQRRREPQGVTPKTRFVSNKITHEVLNNTKLGLNVNPNVPAYNQFAGLYSTPTQDVPKILPKAIFQDYENLKQPLLQQGSASLPYATPKPISLNPISPALLRLRPTVPAVRSTAPYYDNSLLLPQYTSVGKLASSKNNEVNVGTNVPPPVENADKAEDDITNDKSTLEGYGAQSNYGDYKTRKLPSNQDGDQHPYRQQNHSDNEQQDKYRENYDVNYDDKDKPGNAREEDEEDDEEDTNKTRKSEYGENKDEDEDHDDYDRYDKYKFDQDTSEEEQQKKQRYRTESYDDEDTSDKDDHYIGDNRKLNNSPRRDDREHDEDDREYSYNQQESVRDNHYNGKGGRDVEHEEPEDELVARHLESQHDGGKRGEHEKKKHYGDGERKYYGNLISPQANSHQPVRHKHEEYSETNPKYVHEKYQHQEEIKDRYRDPKYEDNGNKDQDNERELDHGETQEHAHKHEEHHDEKKHKDHKFEEGKGGEHEEGHHGEKGEKGDKGYKVWHEHEKAAKGHHDKEHSSKEYDEKDGEKKKHEEEGGYHKHYDHGEAGKKSANFGEKGEHQKGHSTKGEHSVHKKDEYEKKTEFFNESHEDGGEEKHGKYHHGHESKKGGHEKKAHHDASDHEEKHGKEQKYEKGGHHHKHKGHKVDEGDSHHYDNDHKYGKKGGHEHGKKWSFKKGDKDGH